MGLFNKKVKQTDVETLQQRSKNIVSVFTKTIDDLKVVNQEIYAAREEKLNVIVQLEREAVDLATTADKNASVIEKIEKILT